jgi:hypothetical protein
MSYMSREGDYLAGRLNGNRNRNLARLLTAFQSQRPRRPIVPGVVPGVHTAARGKEDFSLNFALGYSVYPKGEYLFRTFPEADATDALVLWELVKTLQVHRLRQCEQCRKWYFARRETQRFCSVNCRQKAHISQQPVEVRRQKRRETMRLYRARLKANPNLIVRENKRRKTR